MNFCSLTHKWHSPTWFRCTQRQVTFIVLFFTLSWGLSEFVHLYVFVSLLQPCKKEIIRYRSSNHLILFEKLFWLMPRTITITYANWHRTNHITVLAQTKYPGFVWCCSRKFVSAKFLCQFHACVCLVTSDSLNKVEGVKLLEIVLSIFECIISLQKKLGGSLLLSNFQWGLTNCREFIVGMCLLVIVFMLSKRLGAAR